MINVLSPTSSNRDENAPSPEHPSEGNDDQGHDEDQNNPFQCQPPTCHGHSLQQNRAPQTNDRVSFYVESSRRWLTVTLTSMKNKKYSRCFNYRTDAGNCGSVTLNQGEYWTFLDDDTPPIPITRNNVDNPRSLQASPIQFPSSAIATRAPSPPIRLTPGEYLEDSEPESPSRFNTAFHHVPNPNSVDAIDLYGVSTQVHPLNPDPGRRRQHVSRPRQLLPLEQDVPHVHARLPLPCQK